MFAYIRARDEARLQCWKCKNTDTCQRERSAVNISKIFKKDQNFVLVVVLFI